MLENSRMTQTDQEIAGSARFFRSLLGDLLEGIVLHAFDGKCPFGRESLTRLRELRKFYGLDLDSRASHRLIEGAAGAAAGKERAR